jgi:hypothetical protein
MIIFYVNKQLRKKTGREKSKQKCITMKKGSNSTEIIYREMKKRGNERKEKASVRKNNIFSSYF